MRKWRLLVGVVSATQLLWGMLAFIDYSRSVGATGGLAGGWIYSGLGLLGLLVLSLPRCGTFVAVVQVLAAAHALCWLPFVILFLRASPNLSFPVPLAYPAIALLILLPVGATALLCLLSALGTWQVARLTRRFRSPGPPAGAGIGPPDRLGF